MAVKIINACMTKKPRGILDALIEVDRDLVGSNSHFDPDRAVSQIFKFIEDMAGDSAEMMIYLGDSGISRLNIWKSGDEIRVEPTDNFSPEVKKNWELNNP